VLAPFGFRGADFGKRQKDVTPAQKYLREKSALHAAEKYYTPEEFQQLLADFARRLDRHPDLR
jgi:hypothetical protein